MESKKVLAAARPPVGLGPPTSVVLRDLREVRPPAAVLVGFLLSALAPLGLLAAAAVVVVEMSSYGGLHIRFFMVLFTGVLLVAAGLAWRGTKRAVHLGEYDGAFFVPRLAAAFCVVASLAALKLAVVDGEDVPWSFAYVFIGTAVLWLPRLAFTRPSARAWADRALLRRGFDVHDEHEAQLLAVTRPHACGRMQQLQPRELVPVRDASGRGWALTAPCEGCGRPMDTFFRQVAPGRRSEAGGGDRLAAVRDAEGVSRSEAERLEILGAGIDSLPADRLAHWHHAALTAVRCLEELLASIPAGSDTVPRRRRTGRVMGVGADPERTWGRRPLTEQLTRWQQELARLDGEVARRAGGS